ncbi:MAG: tetratricopeptide repeat protein [Chloroflexota bacterium]|nr:tetratricopeptide repeat protein [Chloroflexota bacterium]
MTVRQRFLHSIFALVATMVLIGPLGSAAVWAQSVPQRVLAPDELELFRISADVQTPVDSAGRIRFDTTVNYQLLSASSGFVLLFVFEGDSPSATRNSELGYKVAAGAGQATLASVYQPRPGVETVTLLAGLFKEDETLLAWSSTTPISLSSWPGRAAFAGAMSARSGGDYGKAVGQLTSAIDFAPQNASFYYWRADTQMHLNQYDAAIADFNRALELVPDDRASLVGRGVARLWKDDWQAAIADVTPIIEAPGPADQLTAWALRARGIARAALGLTEPALADYQGYLALAPQATDRATVEQWIAELSGR